MPIGTPAMICGQGVICGGDVHAQRKSPGGRSMDPRIMGGRRVSGVAVPAARRAR